MPLKARTKHILNLSLKIILVVLAFIFIYKRLADNTNLENFREVISNLDHTRVGLVLTFIFLMMLLNWFIESVKWRFVIQRVQQISLWRAIESVFCGLTMAVFTPNRIGEYGGRVFFLSPRKRILGVVAMGVGAMAQMVITNVLGALALLAFTGRFLDLDGTLVYALTFMVGVFCAFFILFYFNIRWVENLLMKVSFLKRYHKFFNIIGRYRQRELWRIFGYSLARFAVFTSQYYFLLNLLIPGLFFADIVMMVCILFFIQSALPSLDFLDVGVRTMTATYFFSFITGQEVAVMAVTACIWLVNLIIPAILGSVFVFKLNFFGPTPD